MLYVKLYRLIYKCLFLNKFLNLLIMALLFEDAVVHTNLWLRSWMYARTMEAIFDFLNIKHQSSIIDLSNLCGKINIDVASVLRESIFLTRFVVWHFVHKVASCRLLPPSILTQNNQQHNLKEQRRKGKTWREKPWS